MRDNKLDSTNLILLLVTCSVQHPGVGKYTLHTRLRTLLPKKSLWFSGADLWISSWQ